MNHTSQMFQPQTWVEQKLADFWDMLDISENMGRIEDFTETISNGTASRIHAVVFFCLTICGLVVTWHFDIESTIIGMEGFTSVMIPGLPLQAAMYSAWIVAAFSVMPTFLEVFTAGLAKFDVKIVQILIIGMTIFDTLTDMPRAYELTMNFWPSIQRIPLVGGIVFWVVYCIVQFLATLGFEIATVVFAYATLIFLAKASKQAGTNTKIHSRRPNNTRTRRQPIRQPSTATAYSASDIYGGSDDVNVGYESVIITDDVVL